MFNHMGRSGGRGLPSMLLMSPPGRSRAMPIAVSKVRDVADGAQPGQFEVGGHAAVQSLSELDPVYKRLLDEPVVAVVSVTGRTGLSNLTPGVVRLRGRPGAAQPGLAPEEGPVAAPVAPGD